MTTDTSESGLERLICTALTGHPCDSAPTGEMQDRPATYGVGWIGGMPEAYDREYCVDLVQLTLFLRDTQPEMAEAIGLDTDGPVRRKFLARLQGDISKRGTINLLRHGLKHGAHHIDLFYGTPSPGKARLRIDIVPTVSASPASCVTAAPRRNGRLILGSLLTDCRWRPLS